jgi:hypothetical protein
MGTFGEIECKEVVQIYPNCYELLNWYELLVVLQAILLLGSPVQRFAN